MEFEFLNWDDDQYITENPTLEAISWGYVKSSFRAFEVGNYHPLTMISYALDMRMSGYSPGGYRRTSLFLHLLNTLLVFLFAKALLKDPVLAIFCAAFFGSHPSHVEPVVWISSRKDLLSTFFYLAALIGYLRYLDRKKPWILVLCFLAFLCACLSKATSVTLPMVLVLVLWYKEQVSWKELLRTAPFFLASLIFGLVAIEAQHTTDAIGMAPLFDPLQRLVITLGVLSRYALHLVTGSGMSGYHPYPDPPGTIDARLFIEAAIQAALLVWVFVVNKDRTVRWGYAFYLIALLPVLQLFPVGGALMADRYSYLSSIGVFVLLVVAIRTNLSNSTWRYSVLIGIALLQLIMTLNFLPVWSNSISLWSDVRAKHPNLTLANWQLARAYMEPSKLNPENEKKGLHYYSEAIRTAPTRTHLINEAALAFAPGHPKQALVLFSGAIKLDGASVELHFNRGEVQRDLGRFADAIRDYRRCIELDSTVVRCHVALGQVLGYAGNYDEALVSLNTAVRMSPDAPSHALAVRASVLFDMGELQKAQADLERTLVLDPNDGGAYHLRALVLLAMGDTAKACSDLALAQRHLALPGDRVEVEGIRTRLCTEKKAARQ